MAVRKIPITDEASDNPEIIPKPTETPAVKPPVRRKAPATPRTTTTATAAKTPATRTRRAAPAKTEPEVPTKDDVKEITAINDENSDEVILANEEKPKKNKKMKDDEKEKKKKKKKKSKAKKEKAKKKAQK